MASEIKVDTIVNAGGDNDTGIDLATNDQILLKVANATKLTMNSTGQTTIVGEGGTTTTNLQQGLAKTWCHLDLNTENTIDDSLNVASITDVTTGKVTVTSTNAMGSISYTSLGNAWNGADENYDRVVTPNLARTTTVVKHAIALTSNHALTDCQDVDIVNHGDLA